MNDLDGRTSTMGLKLSWNDPCSIMLWVVAITSRSPRPAVILRTPPCCSVNYTDIQTHMYIHTLVSFQLGTLSPPHPTSSPIFSAPVATLFHCPSAPRCGWLRADTQTRQTRLASQPFFQNSAKSWELWVKKIPSRVFLTFFPKRMGIFSPNFYVPITHSYLRWTTIFHPIAGNFDKVMPY